MPESFKAATPYPIKYSTSENEYEDQEKYPKTLSLFIPVESVSGFCDHLMKLVDTKQKKGKVWDFSKNEEVEVDGIYINAKGKEGKYGDFGNINLRLIENSEAKITNDEWESSPKIPEVDEIPF